MADDSPSEASQTRSKSGSKARKPYDPEELIGKTLGGRYEVEKCIGKGGMGVVYLARQSALDRSVVVKVLPRSFVDDEEALARFEREALGMSRLQHPNIVSIYDFGHDDDQGYICMEFVDGETLSRRIKRDGPIDVEEFAPIAAQILQGIGEAHSLGMIHRDIKPSNIMLTERHGQQNYVKILDFGLAKLVKGARNVTKEQALVGSTAFLSPEQIMGNDIDQRVDVYALGVLFYYMLTGEKPFVADDDITVLYQHVHNAPPPLADKLPEMHRVPAELVELVERMLAKQPDDRPPNTASIVEELTGIMATTSLQIRWTTGEFAALSPSSSAIFDDPSDRLERGRRQTPIAQQSPHTSPSHVALEQSVGTGTQPSGSFITSEQMLQMQRENTRRSLVIALVAALVVAGGVTGFMMWRDRQSRAPVPIAPAAPAAAPAAKTPAKAPVKKAAPVEVSIQPHVARARELVGDATAAARAQITAKPVAHAKPAPTPAKAHRHHAHATKPAPKAPAKPTPAAKPHHDNGVNLLPMNNEPKKKSSDDSDDGVKLLPIE